MATVVRGKALRQDLALYDGRSLSAHRTDATGGTLTGLVTNNEVDVLQVYGDGENRTAGTIAHAVTQINTGEVTLAFAPGTWTISSNTTIPANFTCRIASGCVFSVASGVTLTFNGSVIVEKPTNWFTGSGSVVALGGAQGAVYVRTDAEREAGVTPANFHYPPGHIYRYKSGSTALDATNDWSAALQAAVDQSAEGGPEIIIPSSSGFYRCDTTIDVSFGCHIRCSGTLADLRFYGCNGFDVAAGTNFFRITNLLLYSLSADGTDDPRDYVGINVEGTAGSNCNYFYISGMYLRGWEQCINLEYTWNAVIDGAVTVNVDTCVRLFGQSVECKITNSFLIANSGIYSVHLEKDGAIRPEGLHISDTTLANGEYGLYTDGTLSLTITNCVIDQIGDTGVVVVNCPAFNISTSWIYAANYGVHWGDLGVAVEQQASIVGCTIETTAADSRPVWIGSNNTGIAVVGSSLTCGATGTTRCIYVEVVGCDDISAVGCYLDNPSSNKSVFVGSGSFRGASNTGVDTVEYYSGSGDYFTGTLTGISGSDPTMTITVEASGDFVDLTIPETYATSDTTACTITGMPAAWRPTSAQTVNGITVQDNTTEKVGRCIVGTDGVITLHNGYSATFTGSGTKGIGAGTIRYRRF